MTAPTPRELEVLGVYVRLRSCKLAAHELGIHPDTLRHTLSRLYCKLGVHRRDEAAAVILGCDPANIVVLPG